MHDSINHLHLGFFTLVFDASGVTITHTSVDSQNYVR
jgi:hypothetical protein